VGSLLEQKQLEQLGNHADLPVILCRQIHVALIDLLSVQGDSNRQQQQR
jgi:hypothetical protein